VVSGQDQRETALYVTTAVCGLGPLIRAAASRPALVVDDYYPSEPSKKSVNRGASWTIRHKPGSFDLARGRSTDRRISPPPRCLLRAPILPAVLRWP
jgi:hypothetical protein